MNVKELIQKHSWDEIRDQFFEIYPEQLKNERGYKRVYEELLSLELIETDMSINYEIVGDEDETYISVHGTNSAPHRWAIDFIDWRAVLNMPIVETEIPEVDILAATLYEITFYGWSNEQVQLKSQEMFDMADELINEIENEPTEDE